MVSGRFTGSVFSRNDFCGTGFPASLQDLRAVVRRVVDGLRQPLAVFTRPYKTCTATRLREHAARCVGCWAVIGIGMQSSVNLL